MLLLERRYLLETNHDYGKLLLHTATMSSPPTDVIDWTEAMQQTGDDEEFLRELLADLRQETDTQVANIEQIIQVGRAAGLWVML